MSLDGGQKAFKEVRRVTKYLKMCARVRFYTYFCSIIQFMATLYLVPTPVGNMEDITARALRILREADLILAEDTRTSGNLLRHFGIRNAMLSYHKFNEHQSVAAMVERLKAGETIAVITDAGTPGISDPGFLLVREAVREGVEVITLPGATAFVPALVSSGLPCDKFVFEGFLPQKKGRMTRLRELQSEPRTMILYESPHRVVKLLEQMGEVFGMDRPLSACREISKMYEQSVRGTVGEVLAHFQSEEPRGEFVIVVGGNPVVAAEAENEEKKTSVNGRCTQDSAPRLSKYQRKQLNQEEI